jgi:major membrane immunogen (membrane-anchored lipoprotein)
LSQEYTRNISADTLYKGDTEDDNNNNNNNNLTIEIQCMWNVKTKVIPVIIGATGTISKSFRKYVSNILGNREVKEIQKTAILGTAHIFRKVLT